MSVFLYVEAVNSEYCQIFDIPSMGEDPFEARMAQLEKLFDEKKGTHADAQLVIVQQTQVRDREHVLEKLKEIETLGGEGVMLRKAESKYFGGRSNTLLKLKVSPLSKGKIGVEFDLFLCTFSLSTMPKHALKDTQQAKVAWRGILVL